MSTFVKNYYSPKNPDLFLSVSWEMGYRNIQIYCADRLVHTISQPSVLEDWVKIQDEELGTIKVRFTTVRPRKLEIKVNNRKFKTVNKFDKGYDYTVLVANFTVLCAFAGIESFILGAIYDFDFSNDIFTYGFIIGFVIALFYGVSSYLLSKRINWIYFMATGVFSITTLLSALGFRLVLSDIANYFILIIRLAMLTYMYLQLKHIVKEMKKSRASGQRDDLLDS